MTKLESSICNRSTFLEQEMVEMPYGNTEREWFHCMTLLKAPRTNKAINSLYPSEAYVHPAQMKTRLLNLVSTLGFLLTPADPSTSGMKAIQIMSFSTAVFFAFKQKLLLHTIECSGTTKHQHKGQSVSIQHIAQDFLHSLPLSGANNKRK